MASPLPRTLDVARSLASTLAQQGRGIATRPAGRQPADAGAVRHGGLPVLPSGARSAH